MARPRKTKVDAIRFRAESDGVTREFSSRIAANAFAATARRKSNVEPIYFRCRPWVLEIERVPLDGEELFEYEDYGGHKLIERELVLKGPDADLLAARGEALRRASFQRDWSIVTLPENLRQLSPESRRLALECKEAYYEGLDASLEHQETVRETKRIEAERKIALDAIPTVASLFAAEVDRKVREGKMQRNTGDIYRYEASAFDLEASTRAGRKALGGTQVHEVTRAGIKEWFGTFAARPTKFGRLPASKTCETVLTHLKTVGAVLKGNDELAEYAAPFDVVDALLKEVKGAKTAGDGWRNRHRLTNDAVARLIAACATDLERAAVALALAGPRPPSEPVALRWEHLERDESGHLWWHVAASAVEHVGGELEQRSHTKTKDVDHRQLSIAARFVPWIEARRGRSEFVLGRGDAAMRPSEYTGLIEDLLTRAGVDGAGISTYSLRHTVGDEVERLLGRTVRDLVLHGRRDQTTGSLHYSHALRDRRRREVTVNGRPYSEHMVWAEVI